MLKWGQLTFHPCAGAETDSPEVGRNRPEHCLGRSLEKVLGKAKQKPRRKENQKGKLSWEVTRFFHCSLASHLPRKGHSTLRSGPYLISSWKKEVLSAAPSR